MERMDKDRNLNKMDNVFNFGRDNSKKKKKKTEKTKQNKTKMLMWKDFLGKIHSTLSFWFLGNIPAFESSTKFRFFFQPVMT